ncbi:hypothetical protein EDB83DRAFT_2532246 [Lactarius deliciosus]|nr:hypothetical protein EDB83DRAFT_2532246 [Lactarius deliciosus]
MSAKTPLLRSTGMALRAQEKDSQKHPGKPDLPRQKRSSSIIQAEKVEKACTQTEKEEMRGEKIQETANIEAQMEEVMKEKLVNAHRPQPSTQKKVLCPRNKVPQVSKGATSDIPECPDGVAQDEVPRDGSEEYIPDDGKDTVESEDNESDILDESDPGKEPMKQRTTWKEKPNQGSLQAAVQAAQGKSVQGGDLKCKAGSSVDVEELSQLHSQKKYKKVNTGLYDDWSKRAQHLGEDNIESDVDILMLDTTDQSQSHSVSSVVSFSSSSRLTTSMFNSDDNEGLGGISDNAGETSECMDLVGKPVRPSTPKSHYVGGSHGLKLRDGMLTRVISMTSVPTFIKLVTSSLVALMWRKKGDIQLSHLSAHLQTTFVEDFTPHLYELFGSLTAWEQPLGAVLQRLWKRVFPHEKGLNFQTGDGVIVLKLIEDRLSHWRKRFREHGLEWALSSDDNSCHPFYYSTYEEPDLEMEAPNSQSRFALGIFQSLLIAAILGTHMAWVCGICDEDHLDRKPVGTLVHSIQAAKCAISWWETGELVKPKKPLNEYSKVNWGDHVETQEGHTVHITSTSNLVAIISKLKDKQWDKILKAALLSAKCKKKLAVIASEPLQPQSFTAQVEPRDDNLDLTEEDRPRCHDSSL